MKTENEKNKGGRRGVWGGWGYKVRCTDLLLPACACGKETSDSELAKRGEKYAEKRTILAKEKLSVNARERERESEWGQKKSLV